jgi:hypothetical protein
LASAIMDCNEHQDARGLKQSTLWVEEVCIVQIFSCIGNLSELVDTCTLKKQDIFKPKQAWFGTI